MDFEGVLERQHISNGETIRAQQAYGSEYSPEELAVKQKEIRLAFQQLCTIVTTETSGSTSSTEPIVLHKDASGRTSATIHSYDVAGAPCPPCLACCFEIRLRRESIIGFEADIGSEWHASDLDPALAQQSLATLQIGMRNSALNPGLSARMEIFEL